ncbi:MAG TPA: hypothetical protein DDX54_02280 [Rhodospirillaceae bacterium]|jgi:hypothetical protein|nr:hypothetical protein [Alphaproteobacteria bacterium]HBH26212.1 hypothetical protein [Rhodospirillaceae bacterium]
MSTAFPGPRQSAWARWVPWFAAARIVLAAPVTAYYGYLAFAVLFVFTDRTIKCWGYVYPEPWHCADGAFGGIGVLAPAAALTFAGLAGMWITFLGGHILRRRRGWLSWVTIALIACGITATAYVSVWIAPKAQWQDLGVLLAFLGIPWALSAYGAWHIRLFLRAPVGGRTDG